MDQFLVFKNVDIKDNMKNIFQTIIVQQKIEILCYMIDTAWIWSIVSAGFLNNILVLNTHRVRTIYGGVQMCAQDSGGHSKIVL